MKLNFDGIVRMLDCSTAHLDRASRDVLRQSDANSLIAYSHDYGWFSFVHGAPCDDETPVLRAIWDAAREADCDWIKFDADGTDHEGLTRFDDWKLEEAEDPEVVLDEETSRINHYCCPECDHEWADEWSCAVDDDCGNCGCRHITPYFSAENENGETEEARRHLLAELRAERAKSGT